MVGIVQARDDMGHAEQMVGHLRAHEVRVVQLGDGGQHIALFHAGTDEHVLVEPHALHRAAVEVAAEVREGVGVLIDAADVVLMKSRLSDVPAAIRMSKATLRNIHENLFWAFFYNVIGIPLAAGIWYPIFGWKLNPMFGAAAMSLSSFCVVTNALRLNWFKMYDASTDKKIKSKVKEIEEEKTMTKTMKIEGMMCGHCEATVKKTLEAIEGVEAAEVSHENGTAVVTLAAEVADEVLKKAVEDKDYKVTGIE